MFTSVRIQNFRQFKDLKLENLARINLITGKNNTGKTSLLEALYLHATPTDPNALRILASHRDMASMLTDGRGAWGWIFREGSDSESASIVACDASDNRSTLKILTSRALQLPQAGSPVGNGSPGTYEPVISTSGRPLHSLVFEFTDSQGRNATSRIRIDDGTPIVERPDGRFDYKFWYQATKSELPIETVQIYSRVVGNDREDAVIDVLRVIDSRVRRLRVLDTGTGPSIHADFGVGGFLPASVAGRGFSRMLTLASVIVDKAGGRLFIDEIEDGLHYSVLQDMWKAIVLAAVANNIQIFATTHSLECIEAAVKGSEGYENTLAFYRLERDGDDIEVVEGSDSRLRSAVKVGYEIR